MTRRLNIMGWTILTAVFLGISVYLFLNSVKWGVTPDYRLAASRWWSSESMYPGRTHGFLYAPAFAVYFSPFSFCRPAILGEILWRALGFGLFGWGLWRLSKIALSSGRLGTTAPCFLWIVVLAVPASLASLSSGQTNLPLSACLILAVLALREAKWKQAAFWLSLGVILKPFALAPWLLALAVVPAVRGPLLLGIPAWILIGFCHPSLSYASSQWVEFFQKLFAAYSPERLRVSDLFGALERAGWMASSRLEAGVRASACLGALAWVWHAHRRNGLAGAAWALWAGTALVFTVFNPRAETNSYVLISPLLAFTAVNYWREVDGGRWKGVVLAVACFGLMCDGMGLWIYKATDVWFKPLIVLLVSPLLFRVPRMWKAESGRRED